MQGNRATDTGPEVTVRRLLHREGLRFFKHRRPVAELRCRADVVFVTEQVAVFIDGCFWHGCPQHGRQPRANSGYWAQKLARNMARDRRNDALLESQGWLVLRAWEHEPSEAVVARVAHAVAARRRSRG
jgi:DNA mismatch endonuclease (patch repair protein)